MGGIPTFHSTHTMEAHVLSSSCLAGTGVKSWWWRLFQSHVLSSISSGADSNTRPTGTLSGAGSRELLLALAQ